MSADFSGLFEGTIGALIGLEGIDSKDQRGNINSLLYGAGGAPTNGLYDTINTKTNFTPYSISAGSGKINNTATGTNYSLSPTYQGIQDNMFSQGQQLLGQAAGPTDARETEIYNRLRAMQQPEEQRAYDRLQSSMFSTGRGGMGTSAYGGTPEQLAYEKAVQEAQNSAAFGASLVKDSKTLSNKATFRVLACCLSLALVVLPQTLTSRTSLVVCTVKLRWLVAKRLRELVISLARLSLNFNRRKHNGSKFDWYVCPA